MSISRNQLRFDGVMVDRQEGKFSGTFDVDGVAEQEEILMDAYVLVVTVARCGPATIKPIEKTGDRVRVDTLKVQDARVVVDADLRDVLVDRLDLMWPEKLALEGPEPKAPEGVDDSTGEITEPAKRAKKATKKAAAKPKAEVEPEVGEEEEEEDWEDLPPPPPPRSGVVGDAERPAPADRSIREEDIFDPTRGDRELIGQVTAPKDPVLASFMESPG